MTRTAKHPNSLAADAIVVDGDALQTDINGRRFIQYSTDANVFVQAGAGSGKTTTLIQRLLTLLIDDGLRVSDIAAITFTEAAAAKLVADLRLALTQVAATGRHKPFPDADATAFPLAGSEDEAKRRANAALDALPGAAVSTLHSFCLRLLKQFPLEAGLPPKVEKVDELRQQLDAALRVDGVIDALLRFAQGSGEAVAELRELQRTHSLDIVPEHIPADLAALIDGGISLTHLGDAARWMDQRWGDLGDTLTAPRWVPDTDSDHGFLTRWRDLFASLEASFLAAGGKDTDKRLHFIRELRSDIDGVRGTDDPDLEPLRTKHPGRGGSSKEWAAAVFQPDVLRELQNYKTDGVSNFSLTTLLVDGFQKEIADRRLVPLQQAMDHVLPVLAALVSENVHQRVRRGALEYQDMVYLAKHLVRDPANDPVRRKLHEQYKVLIVDEFQDTDPAQYDIVRTIAAGSLDGSPAPGSLFVVGDPKQSIYRFRHADIDNYNAIKSTFSRDGSGNGVLLSLTQNFRSSESVISAVNDIFKAMFDDDGRPTDHPTQAAYEPMLGQPAKDGELPDGSKVHLPGRVLFLRSEDEDEFADTGSLGAEEADIIALVRAATENNDPTFLKHSPKTDKERELRGALGLAQPLTYSDIAILVPTNDDSRRIVRALTVANIPSVSEGSSLLFRTPEIDDVLTILRAVTDPADDFTQIAALRTALLGCSDDDLVQEKMEPGTCSRVVEKKELLSKLRKATRGMPVGEQVRHITNQLRVQDAYVATNRAESLGNLHMLHSLADRFGAVTGLGLRDFVRWADEHVASKNGAAAPVLDNQANGVRVMTVHRSKGLEFPMVIAGGLSRRPPNHSFSGGFARTAPRTANLNFGKVKSPDYDALKDYDSIADADEKKRVFYVALTRAESVLAVPLQIPRTATKKDGDVARYMKLKGKALLETVEHVGIELVERSVLGAPTEPLPPQPAFENPTPVAENTVLGLRKKLEESSDHAPRVGVTAIAHAGAEDAPREVRATTTRISGRIADLNWLPRGVFDPVDTGVKREEKGTAFGSAVHEVMERLPSAGQLSVEDLAQIAASRHMVPEEHVAAVAQAARQFAESEPYLTAAAARPEDVFRELPIIGTMPLPAGAELGPADAELGSAEAEAGVGVVALNGFIDLLYRDGDDWVIADYKTDVYAPRATLDSYFLQLELYARLLGDTLGTPVQRLELIFLDGGGTQVVRHHRATG